ncbi:MAG: flagellar hook-length control protein FliK [Spirochaetaceae bacterium]|jgi:hypothetical protein|nr:flagellar hook-length control protein FliK [Spirochaetaceae bacterium]
MQAIHILPPQIDTVQTNSPSSSPSRDGNSFQAAFEAAQKDDVRHSDSAGNGNAVQKEGAPRESAGRDTASASDEVHSQDTRVPGSSGEASEVPDGIRGQSYSAILSGGEMPQVDASGAGGPSGDTAVQDFAGNMAAETAGDVSLTTDTDNGALSLREAGFEATDEGSLPGYPPAEISEAEVRVSAAGIADESGSLTDEKTDALRGKKTASAEGSEKKRETDVSGDVPVIGGSHDTSAAPVIAAQGAENAGLENSGNVKKADRQNRDGRTVIEVRDERTALVNDGAAGRVTSTVNGDGTADMSLSFSLPGQDSTGGISEGAESRSTKTVFSSMLADELQNNAGELVKTGSIILRDNNSGSIRLTLHPEELGNVKINMELTDKIISGRIVVATEEAFQAFRSSLQELRDAFIAGGFENAGFELSLASGSGEQSGGGREGNPRAPFYDASVLSADTAGEEAGYGNWFRSEIDVLA